jgi:hypothetical protein
VRLLAPVRLRLFLVLAASCALFFATNIVREHYPAFALAQHGDLRCDEWAGLHPDLFQHRDGHWYANNNAGASLAAAPLLFVFRPLLAKLEEIGKRQAAIDPAPAGEGSEYPLRQKFMAEVRKRGLHLRFGAAAAVTSTLLMAPAAALLALLVHDLLRRRGVSGPLAVSLTLLFAFGTPLLFRSATLNHNQLEALVAFASFALLWRGGEAGAPSGARLVAAGLLAGASVLLDYSGLVLLAGLGLYAVACAAGRSGALGGARAVVREATPFALGALASLGLLWFTQWWQFGDPFLPAQRWMPDAHFSTRGWHGFAAPSGDLLAKNLFDPSYGLFVFAPLLLLALLPPSRAPLRGEAASVAPILPRRERLFVLALAAAFLVFSSANQFARLQWNTGFRALAPLVPFLFLAACDLLARLPKGVCALVAIVSVPNALVLAMARATPPLAPAGFGESTLARSWNSFFEHGVTLPWFTVWRQTQPSGGPQWTGVVPPLLVIALGGALALLWSAGARAARGGDRRGAPA